MNLRAVNDSDLSRVISWISDENECKLWAGPYVSFPLAIDSLRAQISCTPDNSFCIEKKGKVIAFGQLIRKSEDRLHFARIIVHPAERGNGYGRILCSGLIDKANNQNCRQITLNVYRQNTAALKLYKSLGFVEREAPAEEMASKDNCFMVYQQLQDLG